MIKNKIATAFSIILFIIAGLLIAYTIWSFTYCADIISQAKVSGQLATSGNEYDIASFYMGNCGQYFVFALLLTASGFSLLKEPFVLKRLSQAVCSEKINEVDTELDAWFSETAINNDDDEKT